MEAWEWLAGVMRELGVCGLGQRPPLISARQAGAPWEWSLWGDGHPFPLLGVKVLGGKVGKCGDGGEAAFACYVCSGSKCLSLSKDS